LLTTLAFIGLKLSILSTSKYLLVEKYVPVKDLFPIVSFNSFELSSLQNSFAKYSSISGARI